MLRKKKREDFLYVLYDGMKYYDYVECRKVFYCNLYFELVKDTLAYKRIKYILEEGKNLCLTGWDACEWSEEDDPKCEKLYDLLQSQNLVFGHEMILVCMLMGKEIWNWN